MKYTVPNMKLIPQDKTMSCWYASAMMVIMWRRNRKKMTEAAHPDPSQVTEWQKLYDDNTGITNERVLKYAKDLGLVAVPPMSPTIEALTDWLKVYGPLWVNGNRHITVIAGVKSVGNETKVLVFDPAKPTKFLGEWRDFSKWYINNTHSGRDASNAVRTVFLHAP